MNKQELIKKLDERKTIIGNFQGCAVWWEDIKEIFEHLDEPEKVTIPQFVADIIEEYKDKGAPIIDIFTEKYSNKEYNTWLVNVLNAYDRAARAWLDGYEVKQEKRYKVVMPNVSSSGGVLTRIKHDDSWIWIDTLGTIVEGRTHTRKELEEAGFGWVFDCPGIEIEEVE